jgi:CBS domain containing-hemolysin-like protein
MVADILTHGHIRQKRLREPIIIHDTITISRLLDTLKRAKGQLVLVADEFGTLQGLVTPIDVFEAIAGEFPDEDETPDIVSDGENRWRMDGATDLHHLEQVLDTTGFVNEDDDYTTLAGYLLNYFGQLPKLGDICEHKRPEAIFTFEVVRIEGRRIALVNVAKQSIVAEQELGE